MNLLSVASLILVLGCGCLSLNVTRVPKQGPTVFVHLMPWFETRQTSEDGSWGIHWTMTNQNPDIIVGENDKRQIAAHYYPEIHPYGSGGHFYILQLNTNARSIFLNKNQSKS